jgi:hypothetical protein
VNIRLNLKKTALILTLATVGFAGAAATADAQPLHPAKHEVLARVHAQKAQIRADERAGKISPMKAHRLLAADNRIARNVRARGHLTPAAAHRLNHQENRIHRHIKS